MDISKEQNNSAYQVAVYHK